METRDCTSTLWFVSLHSTHRSQSCLLFLQVPGKAVLWQQVTAYISFTNPLPVPLKGGVFTVEGAGLLSATEIHVKWVMSQTPKSEWLFMKQWQRDIHMVNTSAHDRTSIKLTLSLFSFQWWRSSRPEGVRQDLLLAHTDRLEEAPGGLWLWQAEGCEGSRRCGCPQEIHQCSYISRCPHGNAQTHNR